MKVLDKVLLMPHIRLTPHDAKRLAQYANKVELLQLDEKLLMKALANMPATAQVPFYDDETATRLLSDFRALQKPAAPDDPTPYALTLLLCQDVEDLSLEAAKTLFDVAYTEKEMWQNLRGEDFVQNQQPSLTQQYNDKTFAKKRLTAFAILAKIQGATEFEAVITQDKAVADLILGEFSNAEVITQTTEAAFYKLPLNLPQLWQFLANGQYTKEDNAQLIFGLIDRTN